MRENRLTLPTAVDGNLSGILVYGTLFAGAVLSFCLRDIVGSRFGPTSDLLAIAGDATCGWSWLLVRAIFQRPRARRESWPLALVLTLVGAGAFLRFHGHDSTALPRMIDNLGTLISSALLLLATIEPLTGIERNMPAAERRFRIVFASGYAAMLAIAVIWVGGSPGGSAGAQWGGAIKVSCALLTLPGMGLAIWYRSRNPLPKEGRAPRPVSVTNDDKVLGGRVLRLMADDAAFTWPDLRVADLARHLGEAEYKVTRCITGALGFRNFNHMVNHFRVREAKQRLADPGLDPLPILTIALDCGFSSIGPFNRAFKIECGMPPMHYRKECRASSGRPSASIP